MDSLAIFCCRTSEKSPGREPLITLLQSYSADTPVATHVGIFAALWKHQEKQTVEVSLNVAGKKGLPGAAPADRHIRRECIVKNFLTLKFIFN